MKTNPVGVCDLCNGPIPPGEWYTRRGPRRYCSRECRNTANSRAGNPVRVEKLRHAIAAGRWHNPMELLSPEQLAAHQSHSGRTTRLREVAEGRWRNPALTSEARAKLSRPRKHTGVLHQALEKLTRGLGLADLTLEEQEAHREYRRMLQAAKQDHTNLREDS